MVIIFVYSYQEEEVYQKNIEQLMGLTNPSVTSLIKTMIAKDLIYRIQSKNDGRYYHLHLTPKSLKMIDIIPEKIFEANNELLAGLSDEESKLLQKLLVKLSNSIEEE